MTDLSTPKEASVSEPTPKKRRGRPPKNAVAAQKKGKGSGNPVGRPKGDAAVINEYKARMLASPKSKKVLETIFDAALNDDHKNQAAAWKLVMDRILPTSAFEQELSKGAGRNSISINITGVGSVGVSGESTSGNSSDDPDIVEGEYYSED